FFTTHPKATLIARQAGAGRASGDTGYYDSATPFGDNAWFVVKLARTDTDAPAGPRAFDYYVLFPVRVQRRGVQLRARQSRALSRLDLDVLHGQGRPRRRDRRRRRRQRQPMERRRRYAGREHEGRAGLEGAHGRDPGPRPSAVEQRGWVASDEPREH